ncbi:unnamed protein product, partial [Prorocentrum cordatum]
MKTGFFLDQRESRRQLQRLSKGCSVLDLFSYTGGFAIAAARGGAVRTTTVDQSAAAVAQSLRNYRLNGLEAEVADAELPLSLPGQAVHRLVAMDCGAFLSGARERGELFDIVVCDPPSMAPSEKARAAALRKYVELNRGSLQALREGGLLLTCSCSSHISEDLRGAVEEAGQREGCSLEVVSQARAATDHPVRRGFPEGDYLQTLFVRVL